MKKNIFNKSFSWFLLLLFLLFFISPSVSAKSIGQDSLDSGTLLYQQGKFETAKEAFESAVKLDPGLLQAWDNLGWANLKVGEKEEAVRI